MDGARELAGGVVRAGVPECGKERRRAKLAQLAPQGTLAELPPAALWRRHRELRVVCQSGRGRPRVE